MSESAIASCHFTSLTLLGGAENHCEKLVRVHADVVPDIRYLESKAFKESQSWFFVNDDLWDIAWSIYYIYISIYIYTNDYKCIYIYIYTHTYIYIYI